MSLPQQGHHSPLEHPQADTSQSANVVQYDSIQGALGSRRVSSQPGPVSYLRQSTDSNPAGHMPPSESRYVYSSSSSSSQLPPNTHYPYEQQHYSPPASSYDTPHFTHNVLPRMRTPQPLPESSRTSASQAPQGYGVPYMPYAQSQESQQPQYPVPSGLPWSASYSQYPQTPTDSSLSPEQVRGEPKPQSTQQSTAQYRASHTPYSSHTQLTRPPPPSPVRESASFDSKGKQREATVLPTSSSLRPVQGPDFLKLSQTYRSILDNAGVSTTPLSASNIQPSGLPSVDVLTRLYACALEGIRQFGPSDVGEPPPRSPSPSSSRPPIPKDDEVSKGPNPKKQRTDSSDSQKCMGCGATATPEWRRGPMGPRTLCNACGLVYAKLIKKRGRESAGKVIMEGVNAYAAASAAGTVPDNFVSNYALASGSADISSHHVSQDDDELDQDDGHFSGGDDSDDDRSFDELGGAHSGHGDFHERR